jgi:hypothetical protein
MKSWMLLHVGCSLVGGSMGPSEANLDLWIEPTMFLQSGSFAAVFPWVTKAWWLVWVSWAGAAGVSGAAGPGVSTGPSGVADPASWPRRISLVVCLLDPTRSWRVWSFVSWCTELYFLGACIVVQGRVGGTTRWNGSSFLCWYDHMSMSWTDLDPFKVLAPVIEVDEHHSFPIHVYSP